VAVTDITPKPSCSMAPEETTTSEASLYGVADLGSNTFRLVVVEARRMGAGHAEIRQIALEQRIVRVGQGLGADGKLSPEGEARAAACLRRFGEVLDEHGVGNRHAAFTAAGRDLSGSERVVELARQLMGGNSRHHVEVVIPAGREEAMLSFNGALSLLGCRVGAAPGAAQATAETQSAVLFDIGGGSTEIASKTAGGEFRADSMRLGVVRLTEALGLANPVGSTGLRLLCDEIDRVIASSPLAARADDVRRALTPPGGVLVSNAGTPLTLAAMLTGKSIEDTRTLTGVEVNRGFVIEKAREFSKLTTDEIGAIAGIVPGREDLILAGVAILWRLMVRFGAQSLVVSDGGLPEGLLLERLGAGSATWV